MRQLLLAGVFGSVIGLLASTVAAQSQQPEYREVRIAAGAFSRGEPLPGWADPVPLPAADRTKPIVVRLADTHFLVGGAHAVFVNRAIQVNEASALGHVGQQYIGFVPDYQKLKLHALRVLRGEQAIDKTHSVDLRFLQRETGLEQGAYSGIVTAAFLVDDVRVGDTVQLMYSVEGENPVFGGRYSTFTSWDEEIPVKLRRVTLSHPRGRAIRWKMLGDRALAAVEPETTDSGDLRRLRFIGRDLAAIESEPQLPHSYEAYRTLQFSEYRDWSEVASWALPLFRPAASFPADGAALLERLRALPSREARISGALQWVQSEIRYFSVSLGQSSHRPHDPDIVLQRRYGDCKDKSLLLVSLLQQLGIEARPALVHASMKSGPGKMLPTPLAFDHVVVQVDEGDRFFLDPTRLGQRGRLSRMGQPLHGAEVLVVAPGSAGLARIEAPNIRELVRSDIEERIRVEQLSGEGSVEIRRVYNGAQAEALRVLLTQFTAEQRKKFALRGFERRYQNATLVDEPQVNDDAEQNSIVVLTRLKSGKVSFSAAERWLVPITAPNFNGAFPMPAELSRSMPLGVPTHPYEARYTLEVLWPEKVSALRDPFSERIDNAYFSFRNRASFRGNRARYELSLGTRSDSIEPSAVKEAFEDIRRVGGAASGSIFLARAEVREVVRFSRGSLADSIRERLQQALERTSKTIGAGRLTGADLAEALCTRSETLAELGRTAEALRDGNEAVRAAPSEPRALACRGNAHWHAAQFAQAVADYSKALALGESDFQSFYRRGLARFYLGKLDEAADDFRKAVQTGNGDALYAELWLAWTLKRLGQALPAELTERARADARAAWPRPALAMLAGALSAEQMLQELERLSGDERDIAFTEAWFYVGQNHLAEKRSQAARDAFVKAREKGVVVYIEHTAAGFELRQLENAASSASTAPRAAADQR
jgi:lipoprotein NlpI/transglutaminase-like putative cysteine protease